MSDEQKLLDASINGDTTAFEKLVTLYQSLICAITFSGTGRVDLSEELAQETFLNAWKNLRQLKDRTGFRPWLCAIARNMLCNYYRSQKNISCDPATIDTLSAPDDSPADNLIHQEEIAMLQQTLMQLPPDYRQPLVLFYRQGQSCKAVAENLGLNESTVRTRLHRARQMLREEIAGKLEQTIEKTGPGKTFTKAVMVAVGTTVIGISAGTASAAASAVANTGGAGLSSGLTAAVSTITAKVITAAAVVVMAAGAAVTWHAAHDDAESESIPGAVIAEAIATESDEPTAPPPSDSTVAEAAAAVTTKADPIENEPAAESPAPTELSKETPPVAGPHIESLIVHVIDKETSQPIPNAKIRTYPRFNDGKHFTDETGTCTIAFGTQRPDQLNLFADGGDNYIPMAISFNPSSIPQVPTDFTFELSRGVAITGHVQSNQDDQPIEGVTVKVSHTPHDATYTTAKFDLRNCTHITDKDGNWQCRKVPTNLEHLSIRISHPDFAEKRIWYSDLGKDQVARRHISATMKAGYDIKGYVSDEQGNPIENASVFLGQTRSYSGDEVLQTDAEGYFEFLHRTPLNNHAVVTVQAEGYAPELMNLDMIDELQPAQFVLSPAKTLSVRVVDTKGQPIKHARISLWQWRDYTSIKFLGTVDPDRFKYTDSEGRFQWTNAPDDAVELVITKDGYMSFKDTPLTPCDEEYEITLYRPIRIAGQVIDAETIEPIKNFRLLPGLENINRPGSVVFEGSVGWSKVFTDGRYAYDFTSPALSYAIKIEAEGYVPAESDVFYNDQDTISLDFELQKGVGPTGVIVTDNGTPVRNAEVCLGKLGTRIENGQIANREFQTIATSDADGRFSFPGQTQDYPIIAVADEGFGYLTAEAFSETQTIVLSPWARVTGDFYVGSHPVSDRLVSLSYPNAMPHNCSFAGENNAVTDPNGLFTFEKVIPGRIRLYRETYEVEPGQTLNVNLGGDGRTIIGKVTGPGKTLVFGNQHHTSLSIDSLTQRIDPDQFPKPEHFDDMTYSEAADWLAGFYQTQEGKDWVAEMGTYQGSGKRYSIAYGGLAALRPFTVENMPAGRYVLRGNAYHRNSDYTINYDEPLATLYDEFEIPEITEETNLDEVIDLDVIEMSAPLSVGQTAPAFTLPAVTGDTLSLDDFEGKTVLLTFYNSSQINKKNEGIEHYKKIDAAYKDNPDFAMIGVYLQRPAFAHYLAKHLKENDLNWPHGVAEQYESRITFEYAIKNLPYSVLIDSEGIVRAIDPEPDALDSAIEAALTDGF